MKKISFIVLMSLVSILSFAQAPTNGFDWNKAFIGGSFILGFGAGNNTQTTLGVNPEFGYSIFKNIDVGLAGNYIYQSSSMTTSASQTRKISVTQTGIGIFAKLHINDGLFIHAQPEINSIKYRDFIDQSGFVLQEGKFNSSSFLVGVGWGTREVGDMNFFTTILFDLQKDIYSPYRTQTGDIIPIFRSGFNFYFNRKKSKK